MFLPAAVADRSSNDTVYVVVVVVVVVEDHGKINFF